MGQVGVCKETRRLEKVQEASKVRWFKMVQDGSRWFKKVQERSGRFRLVQKCVEGFIIFNSSVEIL